MQATRGEVGEGETQMIRQLGEVLHCSFQGSLQLRGAALLLLWGRQGWLGEAAPWRGWPQRTVITCKLLQGFLSQSLPGSRLWVVPLTSSPNNDGFHRDQR